MLQIEKAGSCYPAFSHFCNFLNSYRYIDVTKTKDMTNPVQQGSQIKFYGTDYTVDSVGSAKNDEIMDAVVVTMGNGVQKTLWWTDREGCTVVKF